MNRTGPAPIDLAQHFVADAMLAIHEQLAAAFRGDIEACRRTRRRAAHATAEAIRNARLALRT